MEKPIRLRVGGKIRELRKKGGLTQEKLAERAEIGNEPLVRQNLILAHQINQVASERNCDLREIAQWISIAHSRICQIVNMLLLSPNIQEEILLSDSKALFNVPEYRLRDITSEADWNKQQELWNRLLQK